MKMTAEFMDVEVWTQLTIEVVRYGGTRARIHRPVDGEPESQDERAPRLRIDATTASNDLEDVTAEPFDFDFSDGHVFVPFNSYCPSHIPISDRGT